MAGFDNEVVYGENWDFRGTKPIIGQASASGDLPIGTGGDPAIKVGQITSPLGTINIGYSTPDITIDLTGGGVGIQEFNVDVGANVSPDGSGIVTVTGTHVYSSGTVANTLTLDVDATANTFLLGAGNNTPVTEFGPLTNGQLIIGSTGLSPVAATLTAGPGITITNGAGSITINSVVYTDQTATTLSINSGTFATAAGAYVLPASPSQGDLIEIVTLSAGVIVTANAGQSISVNGITSSVAGTATNTTAIGDALWLRYRSADSTWYALNNEGIWVIA